MPLGLIVMKWDERVGAEVKGRYPEEVEIQDRTLMQLYSQHEFTGDAGFVTLTSGMISIASYYTGPGSDRSLYVILLLSIDENGEVYEEGLTEIARQVIENYTGDYEYTGLQEALPRMFQRLSVYPSINEEQRLAMIFNTDVKALVLNRLREEVLFPKSELAIWLKDQYKNAFIDTETLVTEFVRVGLMKIASVKAYASDLLFMTGDLMALRVPPIELIKNPVDHHLPASLKDQYIAEVKNYFSQYVPDEADCRKIIDEVILEPANYEVLKLMRHAMVTRDDLEKLRKKGVDDLDKTLKTMWENRMISVVRDEHGVEYYCLVTDFVIEKIFPRYALDILREQYRNKVQNPYALIKAIDLYKEEYLASKKKKSKAEPDLV
jgi:hypothetical protein